MGRNFLNRGLPGALTVALVSGFTLAATAAPAMAEPQQGNGIAIEPGQPYAGNPASEPDWLGSYIVNGQQVFCVAYALKAPDTDEAYEPGDELLTKWGEPIPDDRAAKISYLLLRYGDTDSDVTAAAVAHLLHAWTADPSYAGGALAGESGGPVSYREVAYNIDLHYKGLPAEAQETVDRLKQEAATFRGPWTAKITAPEGEQTIGTPGEWTLTVRTKDGTGVPDVPISLKLTGAMLENGKATGTVTTGEDGSVTVSITPTAETVTVRASLRAPAQQPRVRLPLEQHTQSVVSTGGETELIVEAGVSAVPKPPETTTRTTTRTSTVIVPRTVPAGAAPDITAKGEVNTTPSGPALAGMGALTLLGCALLGWLLRRRHAGNRAKS